VILTLGFTRPASIKLGSCCDCGCCYCCCYYIVLIIVGRIAAAIWARFCRDKDICY